jgi:hypothetical protein
MDSKFRARKRRLSIAPRQRLGQRFRNSESFLNS